MNKQFLKFMTHETLLSAILIASLMLVSHPIAAEPLPVTASTPDTSIQGTVFDRSGEPLIGASVMEKGSTNGTTTDLDGKFSIKVKSPGSTLSISYVGYRTKEIKANSPSLGHIVLDENSEVLDEVVVIGYGTQKKASMTGSVAVVGSEKFENKGALATPMQALQGQVPGVIITRSSGAPGEEGWSMNLRGAVSANATDPLVIVDGVEFNDGIAGLRNMNTGDIESINFLKDASAAIYGSKAAGGVILIQTKKAKEGKTVVTYNGSYTYKRIGLQPQLMSLDQWSDALLEALGNDGITGGQWVNYAKMCKTYKNMYVDNYKSTNPIPAFPVADFCFIDTDWQNLMWGDASATNHELAVSGGSEKTKFRLSLGYMYDGSTLRWGNNSKSRFNTRLSVNSQLSSRVTLESIMSFAYEHQVTPSLINDVLSQSTPQPGLPSSTIDGKPYAWGNWRTPNWIAELGGDNKLNVAVLNISENLKWNIYKDLDLVVQFGYNYNNAIRDTQEKAIDWYNYAGDTLVWQGPTQENSKYTKSYANTQFYLASAYLNWHKSFNDVHNVSIMAGAQYDHTKYERTETSVKDINDALDVPNGTGEKGLTPQKWHEAMTSFFGRANYDFDGRYLIDATFRYDGSSKFLPKNRWQAFWGVSAGWRISDEAFMKNAIPYVSNLKLRLSYGQLGNQSGIGRYDGQQLYNLKINGGVLMNGQLVTIIDTNGQIVSTDRTWERIHNYNIALDFGFFNNRLNGSVDFFLKKNNNMLIDAQYSGILGDKAPTANIGKFEAKGWEGQLEWHDRVGQVSYHVGGVLTYATNKLVDLKATSVKSAGFHKTFQGYPLNSYFGYRYIGKIQNETERQKYLAYYLDSNSIGLQDNIRLGDNMFEDVNGDGKINQEDLVYLGSNDPKLSYSFNFGAEWKGIDVSFIFQGVGNRTIYREDPWHIPLRSLYLNTTTMAVGKTWSEDNPDAYYPSYTTTGAINNYNYQCSTWSVEDGSYLRLKNVTIGYSFPSELLARTKVLSGLRIYLTGEDLWEHSNIKDGWDPEQGRETKKQSRYPFNRNFTAGVSLTF